MLSSIIRSIKRLFLVALAIMSGASVTGCMYGPAPMYGVGPSHIQISGNVANSTGTPIHNIHITVKGQSSNILLSDDTTNTYGSYGFDKYPYSGGETVIITATDEDGPLNGGDFADKTEIIEVPIIEKGDTSRFKVNLTMEEKP